MSYHFGVWLSLVERYVRDVEVACSNHVTPTIFKAFGFSKSLFLCAFVIYFDTTTANNYSIYAVVSQQKTTAKRAYL